MKYEREKWWHYWYGLQARISAVGHWLKGHDVLWYASPEIITDDTDFNGECKGDIICETCNCAIWCRWWFFRRSNSN